MLQSDTQRKDEYSTVNWRYRIQFISSLQIRLKILLTQVLNCSTVVFPALQNGLKIQVKRPEYPITRLLQRLYTQPQDSSAPLFSSAAEKIHVVSMYRHPAIVLAILSWPALHALQVDALVTTLQGSTITAVDQNENSSTLNLTLPKGPINKTFTAPQNFISYRVPHSPTTLLFHSFSSTIPTDEMLRAVALAVGIAFDNISEKGGKAHIARGFFVYSHEFLTLAVVGITVGDFREIGLPMTYYILRDVLRGIGEFILLRGQGAQELQFEVEVQGLGYLGTGHVDYKPAPTPTMSVA